MQDAVVGAAEAVVGEDLVRIGGEVAIGEEEQLDDRQVDAVFAAEGCPYRSGGAAICHMIPVAGRKLCQHC
jgi:hypothetical protein